MSEIFMLLLIILVTSIGLTILITILWCCIIIIKYLCKKDSILLNDVTSEAVVTV
jgi:hypothetical protein